jgi:isoleucyl-tRNA synthetase
VDLGDGKDDHGTTIRQRALKSINELVKFTPVSGQNRLRSMMEARPDWVLSRQRAWGVPLTCFVKKGAAPRPRFPAARRAVNARILDAFEAEGADAWYKPGAKARFLGNDHDPEEYEQVFDILDVWFDSAPPMPSCCATAPTGPRTASPMSTWKAPTSIAAGSIPRCCRPAAPSGARPTATW